MLRFPSFNLSCNRAETHWACVLVMICPRDIISAIQATAGSKVMLAAATTMSSLMTKHNEKVKYSWDWPKCFENKRHGCTGYSRCPTLGRWMDILLKEEPLTWYRTLETSYPPLCLWIWFLCIPLRNLGLWDKLYCKSIKQRRDSTLYWIYFCCRWSPA